MTTVPWVFDGSDSVRLWVWRTPHFEASILNQEGDRSYSYRIFDLSTGQRVPIDDDVSLNFQDAESRVLEVIGKSYPISLDYRRFAGRHATTFYIYGRKRIDFGRFEGFNVSLRVADPNNAGGVQVLTGSLKVVNHHLFLSQHGNNSLKVSPELVIDVREIGGSGAYSDGTEQLATSRTIKGIYSPGCTGRTSYEMGKVDHQESAPWCPVHKI